jgi:hypothetical protein
LRVMVLSSFRSVMFLSLQGSAARALPGPGRAI